ncbi:MAG: YbjQ family protein [Bacteroidales bacterium]|nr:YbjQ family protein [Bacteroidales bacterium]
MKIVTVDTLQGEKYEEIGVVTGSTIQSKNFISDFGQGLKNIVGGELKSYTAMMEKARKQATQRMIDEAVRLGADAIIGVRYTTSAIIAQAAEVLVYGTAIKYKY